MRLYKYKDVADGYKMVGNAVPINLAYHLARKIADDLRSELTSEYKKMSQNKKREKETKEWIKNSVNDHCD